MNRNTIEAYKEKLLGYLWAGYKEITGQEPPAERPAYYMSAIQELYYTVRDKLQAADYNDALTSIVISQDRAIRDNQAIQLLQADLARKLNISDIDTFRLISYLNIVHAEVPVDGALYSDIQTHLEAGKYGSALIELITSSHYETIKETLYGMILQRDLERKIAENPRTAYLIDKLKATYYLLIELYPHYEDSIHDIITSVSPLIEDGKYSSAKNLLNIEEFRGISQFNSLRDELNSAAQGGGARRRRHATRHKSRKSRRYSRRR